MTSRSFFVPDDRLWSRAALVMFGDVYGNRESPGDARESPLLTRLLLHATDSGTDDDDPEAAGSSGRVIRPLLKGGARVKGAGRPALGAREDDDDVARHGAPSATATAASAVDDESAPESAPGAEDREGRRDAPGGAGVTGDRGDGTLGIFEEAGEGFVPSLPRSARPGGSDRHEGSSPPAHSGSSLGIFRRAPLPMTPPRARVYAFDPWTKVAVVIRPTPSAEELEAWRRKPWWARHRLRWCWRPRDASWWVALCYLVGSVGFATGGLASCLRCVVDVPRWYLSLEVMPYVVGGVHFLVATALLVYTSYEARYGEPGRADRRRVARKHPFLGAESWTLRAAVGEAGVVGRDSVSAALDDADRTEVLLISGAMEEARRLWLANDSWTRRRRALELIGAAIILVGVVLYKVMVFTMLARALAPPGAISWGPEKEALLYFYPCLVGSCLFVVGSWFLWCAANRSWTPPMLPSSVSTWIAWLSVVGSVCYLIGSLQAPKRIADDMAEGIGLPWLVPGWPMLFVGFFLGSLVFIAQSLLMIHEIALSANDEEMPRRAGA